MIRFLRILSIQSFWASSCTCIAAFRHQRQSTNINSRIRLITSAGTPFGPLCPRDPAHVIDSFAYTGALNGLSRNMVSFFPSLVFLRAQDLLTSRQSKGAQTTLEFSKLSLGLARKKAFKKKKNQKKYFTYAPNE